MVSEQRYRLLWHHKIQNDFRKIPKHTTKTIIKNTDYRLSLAPLLIGQPLRGAFKFLWKLRFRDYRIIYTVNERRKEVWVLSVQHRAIVYRPEHLRQLFKIAEILQQIE